MDQRNPLIRLAGVSGDAVQTVIRVPYYDRESKGLYSDSLGFNENMCVMDAQVALSYAIVKLGYDHQLEAAIRIAKMNNFQDGPIGVALSSRDATDPCSSTVLLEVAWLQRRSQTYSNYQLPPKPLTQDLVEWLILSFLHTTVLTGVTRWLTTLGENLSYDGLRAFRVKQLEQMKRDALTEA